MEEGKIKRVEQGKTKAGDLILQFTPLTSGKSQPLLKSLYVHNQTMYSL